MRSPAPRAQTPAYRLRKFIRRNRGLVSPGFALYQTGQARSSYENSRLRFEQLRSLANMLPGATPVRARLLKSALGYLDQLASQDTTNPRLKEELAAAYAKIADIQGRPGVTNLGQTAVSLVSGPKANPSASTSAKPPALPPSSSPPATTSPAWVRSKCTNAA